MSWMSKTIKTKEWKWNMVLNGFTYQVFYVWNVTLLYVAVVVVVATVALSAVKAQGLRLLGRELVDYISSGGWLWPWKYES